MKHGEDGGGMQRMKAQAGLSKGKLQKALLRGGGDDSGAEDRCGDVHGRSVLGSSSRQGSSYDGDAVMGQCRQRRCSGMSGF
ncbi:hypothetical protein M0R45_000102 [Rubus argutus]|uniref:Uncharacterized protein n=1 Tax=Rubus argutus TaxID=59490 RepID=A0AAW1VQT4_RUBAR